MGLREESESFERQVSNAVSANPEIQELVQRLEEEQADQLDVDEDIPSGESLARDFEQFLRQEWRRPPAGTVGTLRHPGTSWAQLLCMERNSSRDIGLGAYRCDRK